MNEFEGSFPVWSCVKTRIVPRCVLDNSVKDPVYINAKFRESTLHVAHLTYNHRQENRCHLS